MSKLQCIFDYLGRETTVKLDYEVIKSNTFFQSAYKMHDFASSHILDMLVKEGYTIYRLGADLRSRKVMIKNSVPDYLAEKEEDDIFGFDVKSKSQLQYFGWVNERALKSYRRLRMICDVDVYLFWVYIKSHNVVCIGYSEVYWQVIKRRRAWNGNEVAILKWNRLRSIRPKELR